ncbi:hypothetical protein [Bifidobacterium leontopitheci]|uniref:hypothetical protein n=1 Tax=Bifidobacterium leontopitheci TaxID=2650774 RepID=UPI0012645955|nr:hypothetical protein [Bifidobacterium leontopitheci]
MSISIAPESIKQRFSEYTDEYKENCTVISYNGVPFALWKTAHILDICRMTNTLGWELSTVAYIDSIQEDDSDDYNPVIKLKLPGAPELQVIAFALKHCRRWPVSCQEILDANSIAKANDLHERAASILHIPVSADMRFFQIFFDAKSNRLTPFMKANRDWHGEVLVERIPPAIGSKAKPRMRLLSVDWPSNEIVYESRYPRKEYGFLSEHEGNFVQLGYTTFDRGQKYELYISETRG